MKHKQLFKNSLFWIFVIILLLGIYFIIPHLSNIKNLHKKPPGGNELIKVTALKQKMVGDNLIKAGQFLTNAGANLNDIYNIKIDYTKDHHNN